jgi:hypothetical protein
LAIGSMVAAAVDQHDDLAALLERLEPYRGQHVTTGAGVVSYLGPVELHLGVGALVLGRTRAAAAELRIALESAGERAPPASPQRRSPPGLGAAGKGFAR